MTEEQSQWHNAARRGPKTRVWMLAEGLKGCAIGKVSGLICNLWAFEV